MFIPKKMPTKNKNKSLPAVRPLSQQSRQRSNPGPRFGMFSFDCNCSGNQQKTSTLKCNSIGELLQPPITIKLRKEKAEPETRLTLLRTKKKRRKMPHTSGNNVEQLEEMKVSKARFTPNCPKKVVVWQKRWP